MKTVNKVLWLLAAIAVIVFCYLYFIGGDRHWAEQAGVKFGGTFELTNQNGETVTDKDILGSPHVMFFGFTHCPEICPTTLYEASGWLKKLGPDGDKLKIYFVSVDPERDTPEIMKDYLTAFDPRITALSGSPEQTAKVIADYKIYAKKVPLDDGDYTMDHTATVFLFNSDGSFAKTIAWGEDPDIALGKLKSLIAKNSN